MPDFVLGATDKKMNRAESSLLFDRKASMLVSIYHFSPLLICRLCSPGRGSCDSCPLIAGTPIVLWVEGARGKWQGFSRKAYLFRAPVVLSFHLLQEQRMGVWKGTWSSGGSVDLAFFPVTLQLA